ncbi:alpha 1,4-glycosyltransferase family protein isoform X2 [Tasmannia lanceolata]|uniref:alpha 1,4-glycosyltransferase family protein isoform X2 n=1 Tax=Tasmannia lanceolata TaxID=3420 RepID=UPI004063CDE0
MLKTLRSRRQPRFRGSHICAAVAAILLLLSVSILHSRLGSFRLGLGLGFQQTVASKTNPIKLRNDLADDDAIVDLLTDDFEKDDFDGRSDDRIDIFDEIEEENDEEARVLDEDEEDSEIVEETGKRNSGYFYDHVMGVTRRAFDKQWIDKLDGELGFDMGLKLEDRSKTAFASDDQPVDEDVRLKLEEVKGIEDALLLKTRKGPSKLRDGWAPWFEKKGDFLRKDKMFRSNLDLLNPLHHPLLQDPDSPGSTSLTRGDKLMQKALWREIEKVPFGVSKSFQGTVGKIRVSDSMRMKKIEGVLKGRTVNKKMERRALANDDANQRNDVINSVLSSSNALVKRGGRNKLNSEAQSKLKLKHNVFADGRRWGYFPGLDSHLSFSNFMEQFFLHGKCSMRVFMVWNTPPWTYSVRHQRGLESILYHHPDACIVVFSETIELDFFGDFMKDGFKVAAAMPNLDELLKETPVHVFASAWHEWRKIHHYAIHYSELVRLSALYKYGGVYLDSDVIVLKSLHSLKNSIAMEDQRAGSSTFNGAVMAFERHSPFIMECLREFYSTYDDTLLSWNGADLLTRVHDRLSQSQLVLKIEPPFAFFPISSQNIKSFHMLTVARLKWFVEAELRIFSWICKRDHYLV